MWYSDTLFLWVQSSYFQCIVLNAYLKWSCFISECTYLWDLVTHCFNNTLSERCVRIAAMKSDFSSCIFFINNICATVFSTPWYSKCDAVTKYLEPDMLGIKYCLVWNWTLVNLLTTGIWYEPSGLIYPCTVLVAVLSRTDASLVFGPSSKGSNLTLMGCWMVWSSCLVWNSS